MSVSYALLPSRKKRVVNSVVGSWLRFTRSLKIGVTISMDYLIAPMMGFTESEIHQRSANRIVQGCLQNGGIYIKLGQGLAMMNNILPKEYTESLSTLQVCTFLQYIIYNYRILHILECPFHACLSQQFDEEGSQLELCPFPCIFDNKGSSSNFH